jgi:ADP-L-glycero-D-manno-heptose 6-epimerase
MMEKNKRILITGAAGFIGSYLLGYLNREGFENIVISDEFNEPLKEPNYTAAKFSEKIDRNELIGWLKDQSFDLVYHLGARTDTTEFNYAILQELNLEYSKRIWAYCSVNRIPLVYASSAATYGAGEKGYLDDHVVVDQLKPLNPYGVSKNEFDKWALSQLNSPPAWYGLKFFNVYGPNEYHKERMASVIFHSYNQIRASGTVRLFRSHREGFRDGEQLRDFIYVKDIASICFWFMDNRVKSGLYNAGTGKARTFNDLVLAVFKALDLKPDIQYIDMPEDIRETYQYFTEADMRKLSKAGYEKDFYSLEEGVTEYVREYLVGHRYY